MTWDNPVHGTLFGVRNWELTGSVDVLNWCSNRIADLYGYWNDRRGERPMPKRADIDPVEMRAWLPRLSIVEVGACGHTFKYRLAGTEVADLHGFDPTGRVIEDAWPTADAAVMRAAYLEVVAQQAPVFCHRRDWAQDPATGMMLLLPISTDGERVDQVLGYVTDGAGKH